MNQILKVTLIVIGILVVSALIFGTGMFVGRAGWGMAGYGPAGMMGWSSTYNAPGYSMMGGNGMMGGSMMGNYRPDVSTNSKPLSIDQARKAVEGYLKGLNDPDLEIKEIMIFDNNAYALIAEMSTGIGAMEVLVDPASLAVFPEYGPNMMWNLKYSHMSGTGGMMGGYGMMDSFQRDSSLVSSTMTVTPEQAVKIAQQYLDNQFPGYQTDSEPDAFYGYYTLDILKDGKPTGMLSVNGFSQQVFFHSWHGNFIEMSE